MAFTGCKEAANPVLFAASEDILGDWVTTAPITITDGEDTAEIQVGGRVDIYDEGGEYWVEVWFDLDFGDVEPDYNDWAGIVTPDPTTAAYGSIDVEYSNGGLASPPDTEDEDTTVSFAYNMLGTDAAILYFDGDAIPVERVEDIKIPAEEIF